MRGRDVTARPELVADPDEVEHLYAVMGAANPRLLRFVPLPRDADGRLERTALAVAIAQGFRIVRWHLDAEGSRPGR